MQEGMEMAKEAIRNARAKKKLKQIIEISSKL
jgi:anthranilate phosphoribosyltransferase